MIIVQGRDDTLDPAYFANPPNKSDSGSEPSNLEERVDTLEKQQIQIVLKVNELVQGYNSLEEADKALSKRIKKLEESIEFQIQPISDEFIDSLNFIELEGEIIG